MAELGATWKLEELEPELAEAFFIISQEMMKYENEKLKKQAKKKGRQ